MEGRPEREALRRGRGRGRRKTWALAALAIAVAAILYVVLRSPQPPPRPAAGPAPIPAAVPAAGEPAEPPVTPASAEEARSLLEGASSHPLYRRALEGANLTRRWALALDRIAHGDSPRKPLAALAPAGAFSVVERGGATVIAPASYARYDALGDAVASLDAPRLVSAYRALRGVLQEAYRGLGYPDAALDDVSARALKRLVDAPVRDGDVPVVLDEGLYRFEDRALEELQEVEKHLLRIGPRNTRLVQEKARELLELLRAGP
jgi:hypothetical protein